MWFQIVLGIVAIIAGAIASLAGFGIGSLLTPLVSLRTGIGIAVAGVSIAHFGGTLVRFLLLRKFLDRRIFITFGLTSAAGGLIGALLHNAFQNIWLTVVFGCLLILAGISGIVRLSEKVKLKGPIVWFAGGLSGLFGGLVGNQGGIRSAALLGFKLNKDQFVATATGIALLVDVARVPVYLVVQGREILSMWQLIVIMMAGVIFGTLAGKRVLEKISQPLFQKTVSIIILLVGILVLVQSYISR